MLESIEGTARNSTELGEALGIESNTAGNYLNEAEREGLVECVTPEVDRYKMYRLTQKGRELFKEVLGNSCMLFLAKTHGKRCFLYK